MTTMQNMGNLQVDSLYLGISSLSVGPKITNDVRTLGSHEGFQFLEDLFVHSEP